MEKTGKYIYGIIGTNQERNFGPVGLLGEDVLTLSDGDLSAVVSSHSWTRVIGSRENFVTHEKVLEAVMKEFDSVIPVRFGTVAADADEIRDLLHRRYRELKNLLSDLEHKVELGVKGVWRNMDVIFQEILKEDKDIREEKKNLEKSRAKDIQRKMEIGKKVERALREKKERETENMLTTLKRASVDYKCNKTFGDEMFMNASFLVEKAREKEFDHLMEDLGEQYKKRIRFLYAGPLPVYNFVDLVIYPEGWQR